MEILSPPPDDYSLDFTCERCQAQLRARKEDVKIGRFGVRDDLEIRYYLTCACCGEAHFLTNDTIPQVLRDRLLNEWRSAK